MTRRRVLEQINTDPAQVAGRAARNRDRLNGDEGADMRRRSVAVRRGVYVPPELEERWKELVQKKLGPAEIAGALGLRQDPALLAKRRRAKRRRMKRKQQEGASRDN